MKAKLWFCLRFGSSFLLIAWLLYSIDFKQVWKPITHTGWIYLFLFFVVINIDRALMAYKWCILLKAKGIELSFTDALRGYFFATFWGIFLPSTVGGDTVRAYRAAKQVESKKDIVSSIVLERVLGALTALMVALVCLGVAFWFMDVFDWRVELGLFIVCSVFAVLVFASFHGRIFLWLENKSAFEKEGLWGKLARLYHSYQEYRNHHWALLRFMAWSAVEQCVPIIGVYLTALALGRDVSFLHCAVFVPLIMTLTKFPISLDGYGVREGLYVYLFALVGVSNSDAFVIGLVSHVIANISLLPGFFYSSFFPSKLAILSRCQEDT
jgi:glycosyltransferase 2 family protein